MFKPGDRVKHKTQGDNEGTVEIWSAWGTFPSENPDWVHVQWDGNPDYYLKFCNYAPELLRLVDEPVDYEGLLLV